MRLSEFTRRLILALLTALGAGSLITANVHVEVHQAVTPEEDRNGWVPPVRDKHDDDPQFRVISAADPADSAGAIVKLWEFAKAINGGEHFPTYQQQVGDCVANGAANAVNYLQAVQLARGPPAPDEDDLNIFGAVGDDALVFRAAHRPYIYGISRTAPDLGNRRLGRGDGSVGEWAAEAVVRYGVLPADGEDVPAYSGSLARDWGFGGVPDRYIDAARDFRVRTVARVESYEDVRTALANGYPVTIASNVGFRMQPRVAGGKHWGVRSGSWSHQMCLVAIDDTAASPFGGEPGAAYCLNSWGPAAHGHPADDAPPGGFWIDRATIERIIRQGDSWAYSNFEGFPLRELDLQIFAAAGGPPGQALPDLADFPTDAPTTRPYCEQSLGVSSPIANWTGFGAIVLAAGGWFAGRRRTKPVPA